MNHALCINLQENQSSPKSVVRGSPGVRAIHQICQGEIKSHPGFKKSQSDFIEQLNSFRKLII